MRVVFVFGSNLAGIHGAGAAKDAVEQFGAVFGQGIGLQGYAYAIPTKDANIQTLSLYHIQMYVNDFLVFAGRHPHGHFVLTRIGCGLAGYTDEDIAPMFLGHPDNVQLPNGWQKIIEDTLFKDCQ